MWLFKLAGAVGICGTMLVLPSLNQGSPHPDTNAEDYLESSLLSSKELFKTDYSLGERILNSIKITRSKVKTNTKYFNPYGKH